MTNAISMVVRRATPWRVLAAFMLAVEVTWWIFLTVFLLLAEGQTGTALLVAIVPAWLALLAAAGVYMLLRSSPAGFSITVALQAPILVQGLAMMGISEYQALGMVLALLAAATFVLAVIGRPRKASA